MSSPSLVSCDPLVRIPDARAGWVRRCTGPLAAALVLAMFWALMAASVSEKSLTADETAHAAAGYSYWKRHDFRLNPENGNLPQRVMAIPFLFGGSAFPAANSELWESSDAGLVGDAWFHASGNDTQAMIRRGRGAIALVAVVLGCLVWGWARQLFGPLGGMLALLVYVTSPTILANGPLMVSDTTSALLFLAAAWALWSVLHRLTFGRVVLSGAVLGALFVSKLSAVAIIPIGLTLAVLRVIVGRPWWLGFGWNRELTRRAHQGIAVVGATLAHALIAALVVWAFYGFRYSAFAPGGKSNAAFRLSWEFVLDKPSPLAQLEAIDLSPEQKTRANEILERYDWNRDALAATREVSAALLTPAQRQKLEELLATPAAAPAARVVDYFRQHRLLPEAFLYGAAHTWRFSRMRAAFFNGEYGATGWKTFFPYTVLVKTPLAMFGLLLLAALAIIARSQAEFVGGARQWTFAGPLLYATAPLWCLLAFYWAAVIPSHLNIGHRYVIPTYPPVFILGGAAAWWLEAAWLKRTACKAGLLDRGLSNGPGTAIAHNRDELSEFGSDVSPAKTLPAGFGAPALHPRKTGANIAALALGGLVVGLVVEVGFRYPNYLAYFNGIVTPAQAYHHLVDSSLDWGQDLPGVKRYIDAHPQRGPFCLSYFGAGRPETYGIAANLLICGAGIDRPRTPFRELHAPANQLADAVGKAKRDWPGGEVVSQTTGPNGDVQLVFLCVPAVPEFRAGTYLISASMLPTVWAAIDGPLGPWNARFEATYQELRRTVTPLLAPAAADRARAFAAMPLERWNEVFESYAQFRFARLTAYLRQREPNDTIGYSILAYTLMESDLDRALNGPPPELGIDFPNRLVAQLEPSASPASTR